ncbi:DUF7309 domain-containing protein [Helcococcus kunzii]|uniref:DUF7309 domain-containing protein n=1 Tax=Helcococcus kunzii TaxID=40091 RepID=UPI0024ADD2A1|nr:hypothetical protein [Helcococcus kunzii]
MKVSDKILSLAYKYKKAKIWKYFSGQKFFAIEMKDKKIAYINIFGYYGEEYSLNLYLDDESINAYIELMDKPFYSDFERRERFIEQQFLDFSLEDAEDVPEETLEIVRDFKRRNKIRIGGSNSFPVFRKFQKYEVPAEIVDEKDWEYLEQAITASIELEENFKNFRFKYFTDYGDTDFNRPIPLFKLVDGKYFFDKEITIPKIEKTFPSPKNLNEVLIRKIKKFPKKSQLQCKTLLIPDPVMSETKNIPVFYHTIFSMVEDEGYILKNLPSEDYLNNPENLVNNFIRVLVESRINPKTIKVDDKRTYTLLKPLAKKLKSNIIYGTDFDEFYNAINDFYYRAFGNSPLMSLFEDTTDIEEFLGLLLVLPEEDIKNLPPEMLFILRQVYNEGLLPEEISDKLDRIDF